MRLGRALQHPRLVPLFELIESQGRLALAMAWLPGGSLTQRLSAGPLPIDEVIKIADEALEALEYLHAHGVVHGDVKPSNLLLDADGGIALADLGLARPLDDTQDLPRTNVAVGTPSFMSPELLRGEAPTPAADLYGLVVSLFQLLAGVLPFEGSSQFEVASQHLASPARDPRQLRRVCPSWLARFVLRLLEKRPEDRWPDAGAARRALHTRAGLTSPRVRFEGVNNRLCMYPVVGELVVNNPDPSAIRQQHAVEISESVSAPLDGGFSLAWYTPLDLQGPTHGALEFAGNGNAVLRCPTATLEVDRYGNPVPGPNAGKDLRTERREFLIDVSALNATSQPVTPVGVGTLLEELRARHRNLLRERPYRAILATLGARGLARAGGLKEAIEMLRHETGDGDVPETTLRLAHLDAIAGDLDGAKLLAREVLDGPKANRRYDAAQLLRRLSFEERDVEGVRTAATVLGYPEEADKGASGVTAALWVGAHLWWDELTEMDTRVASSAFAPAGEAAACVARWRLGRTAAGDADAMARSENVNPDARSECRIARAAALLGQGHALEAAALLSDINAHLESSSRDDFEKWQVLQLAEAIYVKALLAIGDREPALRAAAALRPQLRQGLLPRILVEEVLSHSKLDGR